MSFKYQKSIIESIAIFDSTKDNYFDSKSPTARLYIIEPEPEFIYKGEIVLHCIIPLHVFKKVLQDFSEKNSHAIRATISWTFQFIEDPHAPMNYPTNWVLLKYMPDSRLEPLMGYLEELSWR